MQSFNNTPYNTQNTTFAMDITFINTTVTIKNVNIGTEKMTENSQSYKH